jgi:hypothetical protein
MPVASGLAASSFRAVRVDVLVVDGVELVIETRVRALPGCSDCGAANVDVTRLVGRARAGLTLAIVLKARGFVGPAGHRRPPMPTAACKQGTGVVCG